MRTLGLVIPVFTELRYFRELVDSLLPQIRFLDKVVFVDDRNEPSLSAYLQSITSRFDGKAAVVVNSEPLGIARSTREGLKVCDTDFIGFVDSDDVLLPEAVEEILKVLDSNPTATLISSRFGFWDGSSRKSRPNRALENRHPGLMWRDFAVTDNQISHFKVVARHLVERVDWNPKIDGVQDAVLNFSLRPEELVVLIPKVLYLHRVHEAQHSNALHSQAARELNSARKKWLETFQSNRSIDSILPNFSAVGFFPKLSDGLKNNFLVEVAEDGRVFPLDYFREIDSQMSLAGKHLVVRLSDRSFSLTKQIVKLLNHQPESLSFFLESSNPQAWQLARVFSGVFDCILLDNALLRPALESCIPETLRVALPHPLDQSDVEDLSRNNG